MKAGITAGCIVILVALASVAMEPQLPEPATGRGAILLWPSTPDGEHLLSLEGCRVYAASHDDPDAETVYPCGTWFKPERAGQYDISLETPDAVGRAPFVIAYGPSTHLGTRVVVPVVPAGTVRLDPSVPVRAGETFRVLFLDQTPKTNTFELRLDAAGAARGRKLPAGHIIGGVFNAGGDAVALSRIATMEAGGVVVLAPQRPRAGHDVLAVLGVPSMSSADDAEHLQPILTTSTGDRAPDMVSYARHRVFAAWFGVQARSATLALPQHTPALEVIDVDLRDRAVVTVRRTLAEKKQE